MMRRIAVVGDQLQGGGTIQPYRGPSCTLGNADHQVALIGGQAFCAACKCMGTIAKAGGPRRMNFMGEVALDGDVVLCMCPAPQRIVATLAGNAWYEDMGGGAGAPHMPGAGYAATAAPAPNVYDELVIAKGPHGPLAGYAYFVETSDGRGLFGHTDEHGRLPRIATMDVGSLTVYWGDEALAKHLEDEDA